MTIPEGSPSVGRPIYELRLPPDAAIVAILREGHVVIPQPETVFATGDEVVALASMMSEAPLQEAIMGIVEDSDGPGGPSEGPDVHIDPA